MMYRQNFRPPPEMIFVVSFKIIQSFFALYFYSTVSLSSTFFYLAASFVYFSLYPQIIPRKLAETLFSFCEIIVPWEKSTYMEGKLNFRKPSR